MTTPSTQSSSANRTTRPRNSGPLVTSKRSRASASTISRAIATRSASATSGRSSTVSSMVVAASITDRGRPDASDTKRVRSVSWRATRSLMLWASAATSTVPRRRSAIGTCSADDVGSSASRNHIPSCARVSTPARISTASSATSRSGCGRVRLPVMSAAIALAVRASTSGAVTGRSTSKVSMSCAVSATALRESPPDSTKTSSSPTRSTPSAPAHTAATAASIGVATDSGAEP